MSRHFMDTEWLFILYLLHAYLVVWIPGVVPIIITIRAVLFSLKSINMYLGSPFRMPSHVPTIES